MQDMTVRVDDIPIVSYLIALHQCLSKRDVFQIYAENKSKKKTKIIIRKENYNMCMTDDRYFVDIKIIYFQTV